MKLEKNVSFKDWIMSKEVYIRLYFFKSNGGLFVYYLKYYLNLKIGKYPSDIPQFKLEHI